MAMAQAPEDDTLLPETSPGSDSPGSPPPDPLSLSQGRASTQTLTAILLDPHNVNITPGVSEETQATGAVALAEFVEHRLQEEGDLTRDERKEAIQTVERHTQSATSALAEKNSSPRPTVQNLSNWRKKGRKLSDLARSFERSEERKELRREAQKTVDQEEEITSEGFLEMLDEFSQNSAPVTKHRILILFTFISDTIVLSLKKKASIAFARFFDWGIAYIMNRVSTWVANSGGWDAVLGQQWTYVTVAAKLILAGVCAYITYRLAKSAAGSLRK